MQERHLVEELTMLDANNDNITIQVDSDTHLPFRVSFTWRDPLYKDKNEDAVEFADYHPVDGLPTALNESYYHNGDMTSQRYLSRVLYNVPVAPRKIDDAQCGEQQVEHEGGADAVGKQLLREQARMEAVHRGPGQKSRHGNHDADEKKNEIQRFARHALLSIRTGSGCKKIWGGVARLLPGEWQRIVYSDDLLMVEPEFTPDVLVK